MTYLEPCPDCGNPLSANAEACPSCGRPMAPRCPRCGERSVEKVDGLKGSENVVALLLLALFVVPGLAYYFDRVRLPWCSNCKQRVT